MAGCLAKTNADIAAVKGDVAAIKSTISQSSGGDINDTWAFRLMVVGIVAGPCVYPIIIRPLRIAKEKRKQLGSK